MSMYLHQPKQKKNPYKYNISRCLRNAEEQRHPAYNIRKHVVPNPKITEENSHLTMGNLYLENQQIKTINITYHPQLAGTCRALFKTPNLYSWGRVPHFPKQQFYTTYSHNSNFHSDTSNNGYSKTTIFSLSLPASASGIAGRRDKDGDLLYSVHCILRLSEILRMS